MAAKKRRGFTLAEIVISFVLISLLAALVGGVITSVYLMSARLDSYSNAYYAAQDQTEQKLDAIKKLVTEKYRIQNEILNTPPAEVQPALTDRLTEIAAALSACHTSTVTLFGKSVELYDFRTDFTSPDGISLSLCAGLANSEQPERPVPILNSVTVTRDGFGVQNDLYSAAGAVLHAGTDYHSKNSAYYFRTMYQWYLCTDDFHTAASAAEEGAELLYGTVYAQYPNDFTILAGETSDRITVKSEWLGKFIVCVATPLSIEGKMGRSVVSNFVYLSALPKLSQGSYSAVFEPSLTTLSFDPSGYLPLDGMAARLGSGRLTVSGTDRPQISLRGSATDSSAEEEHGHYSRYIEFASSQQATVSGLATSFSGTVFAVARSRNGSTFDFVRSGSNAFGFMTKQYRYGAGSASGWQIVAGNLRAYGSPTLGGGELDLAELIFVSNPSQSDRNAVLAYLSQKYHIS